MFNTKKQTIFVLIAASLLIFGVAVGTYAGFFGIPGKQFKHFQVIGVVDELNATAKQIQVFVVGSNFMKLTVAGDAVTIGGIEGTHSVYNLLPSVTTTLRVSSGSDRKLELTEVPVGALVRLEMSRSDGVDSVQRIKVEASNGLKHLRGTLNEVDLETRMVTFIVDGKGNKFVKNYLPGLVGKKLIFYVPQSATGDDGWPIDLNNFVAGERVKIDGARVTGEFLYVLGMQHL